MAPCAGPTREKLTPGEKDMIRKSKMWKSIGLDSTPKLRRQKKLRREYMPTLIILLMATLILSNCAPRVIPGPVYFYPKVEPLEIELRNFSFYPNHIAILKAEPRIPFTFWLNNSASIEHNFTLMDDRKNILINVDVMPNESRIININPPESGNYRFYCNRFLHRSANMEGMFMVGD